MRVALLNDLPVAGPTTTGMGSGAELSSGKWIRCGTRRGHDIDTHTPHTWHPKRIPAYDVIVTKNVTRFPQEHLQALIQNPDTPYVTWPSDYSWTDHRLFFAFQEEHKDLNGLQFWKTFYTNSAFNTFLSPLHREAYEFVLGPQIQDHPHTLLPPEINVDKFHQPNADPPEPGTAATINGGLPFKGLHNHLEWAEDHPNTRFLFIGSIRDNVNLHPNCEHVGRIPPQELADTLQDVETYIELPNTVQPFNRTAVEGLLATRNVRTNKLLGAASHDWYQAKDMKRVVEAVQDPNTPHWEQLEDLP